jgi:hypothetical protein
VPDIKTDWPTDCRLQFNFNFNFNYPGSLKQCSHLIPIRTELSAEWKQGNPFGWGRVPQLCEKIPHSRVRLEEMTSRVDRKEGGHSSLPAGTQYVRLLYGRLKQWVRADRHTHTSSVTSDTYTRSTRIPYGMELALTSNKTRRSRLLYFDTARTK